MESRDDHRPDPQIIVIVVNIYANLSSPQRRLPSPTLGLQRWARRLSKLPSRFGLIAQRLWNFKGLPQLAAWSSVLAVLVSIIALLK
ncbi:hypothetical protein [Glycomyces tenuis]|uniref:hypothetical protein n=1 Tax=Glycomyces tenuis TaxID=58116 RepID=UPI0012DFB0EF|nr:hypothetical protein [Glycomyces tenuis]